MAPMLFEGYIESGDFTQGKRSTSPIFHHFGLDSRWSKSEHSGRLSAPDRFLVETIPMRWFVSIPKLQASDFASTRWNRSSGKRSAIIVLQSSILSGFLTLLGCNHWLPRSDDRSSIGDAHFTERMHANTRGHEPASGIDDRARDIERNLGYR